MIFSFSRQTQAQYDHIFTIAPNTGAIFLNSRLDNPEISSIFTSIASTHLTHPHFSQNGFILKVIATNPPTGSASSQLEVVVVVIDVNDHAPSIRISPDPIEIPEEKDLVEDVVVGHVMVDDEDEGENGKTDCGFGVDEDTAEVVKIAKMNNKIYTVHGVGRLDREVQERHSILLYCWDHGIPSKNSSKILTVLVKDINDHSPVFVTPSYVTDVNENVDPKQVILKVEAVDADEGSNAVVKYKIRGADGYDDNEDGGSYENDASKNKKKHISRASEALLTIDSSTGEISATRRLDYEHKQQHTFQVEASDKDGRHSVAMVTLNIIDVNDEAPIFLEEKYEFEVEENKQDGTKVGEVEAFDKDSSSAFRRYNISIESSFPPKHHGFFEMEGGVVVTGKMLDREQYQNHHLWLVATNTHHPYLSSTCHVVVHVTDTNDNAPLIHFPSPHNHSVILPCHADRGTVVSKIVAKDADDGINASLEYFVVKGNEFVSIETISGEISLNAPSLELRENMKKDSNKSEVARTMVTLLVKDNGMPPKSAEASLQLVNNCSSAFSTPTPHHQPHGLLYFISKTTGIKYESLSRLLTDEVVVATIVAVLVVFVMVILLVTVCVVLRKRFKRTKKQSMERQHQQIQQNIFNNENKLLTDTSTLKINNNVINNNHSNGYPGNHYHVTPGSKLKDDNIRNEKLLMVSGKGSPKPCATLTRYHDYHDSPTLEKHKGNNSFWVSIIK